MISRQRKWQIKSREIGKCGFCGEKLEKSRTGKSSCEKCLIKRNAMMLKRYYLKKVEKTENKLNSPK